MAVKLRTYNAVAAINMTPLIDMIFQLLIFFLVASSIADEEQQLQLDLPTVNEALPAMFQPNELVVNIDREGKYYIDGQFCQVEQVEQLLRRAYTNNPLTQSVIIRADKQTDWQQVAVAIGLCKKIGIQNYSATTADQ